MDKKIIYYSDELNDDFSGVTRKTKVINGQYKYIKKSPIWKVFEFVVYRIFVLPFAKRARVAQLILSNMPMTRACVQ